HVLDVHVDERRAADGFRISVVPARAAEEDRRAVADVHLRVGHLAVRACDAVLLPEAEGLREPLERAVGVLVEEVRRDGLPHPTCSANIQRWPSRSSTR